MNSISSSLQNASITNTSRVPLNNSPISGAESAPTLVSDQVEISQTDGAATPVNLATISSAEADTASSAPPSKTTTPSTSAQANKKSKKLTPKKMVKKGVSLYKEARYSPLTFVKDHAKKGIPTVLILGVGAAAFLGEALDDEQVDDIKDLAEDAVNKGGGIKKNIDFCNKLADFAGISAEVCCGAGGAILAGEGIYKIGEGTRNTIKGIKKKDSHKVLSGLRTSLAGVRRTLNGAVVGTLSLEGKANTAAKFIKKTVLPPLRKAAAALNIGVGLKSIQKGIKNKSRTKIINGALDLAYGGAVVASIAVGGPIAAAACAGLLAAKTGWGWTKKVSRCIRRDQEIQAQRQAQKAEQTKESDKSGQPSGTGEVPTNRSPLPADQVKQISKANKAKKAVLNFVANITADEKIPRNII